MVALLISATSVLATVSASIRQMCPEKVNEKVRLSVYRNKTVFKQATEFHYSK